MSREQRHQRMPRRLHLQTLAAAIAAAGIMCASCVTAVEVSSGFTSVAPWEYLTRFCFNPNSIAKPGRFEFTITYESNYTGSMNLLVYWLGSESWDRVTGDEGLSCYEREQVARENGNLFPLSQFNTVPAEGSKWQQIKALKRASDNGASFVTTDGSLTYNSYRQRFYFMVLSNCEGRIAVDAQLKMSNGDSWDSNVSADLQGIFESNLTMFIFWMVYLLSFNIYHMLSLYKRKMFHMTVKIYLAALIMHTFELLMRMAYIASFINRNIESRTNKVLYRLAEASADCLSMLLLMVMSKGWTIVRRKISAQGRVKLSVFMTIYFSFHIGVIVNEFSARADLSRVTSIYNSPPGYLLLTLRACAAVWFTRNTVITTINYSQKRIFYGRFWALGTAFILALPIQVLATIPLPAYLLPRVTEAFRAVEYLIFFICMAVLFSPSRFNRSFPFHAKTSDMGARPPASVYGGSGPAGPASRNPRRRRLGENEEDSRQSAVEMTEHGPVFRNRGSSEDSRSRGGPARAVSGGPMAVSGGITLGDPQSRAREAIRKIRRQTNQLNTYSDDLELALEELGLHDWDDYDSGDERGDLPGAIRTGPNASATAAGKRAFDSDSETEPVVEAELPRDDVEQGIGSDDGGERRTMPRPPPLPPVDD